MKSSLGFIAVMFLALAASAQTNSIVFPHLLSPANTVLMTNAEFRCFAGDKLFFKNDGGYQSFHAADLNTNVLNALGTSVAKIEMQQKALADAEIAHRKKAIADAKAKQILAEQKAAAQRAALARYYINQAAFAKAHPGFENPPETTENQDIGAFR